MPNHLKITTVGSLCLAGALTGTAGAEPGEKPNVIYILADDLGIGDLGCYGQTKIKTPGIDRLAANGMMFTQHYCGSTVSAPSRASLLTGKHTGHSYIRGNQNHVCDDGLTYNLPLATTETTVADIFKDAGYSTACFGKWGLGGPGTEGEPFLHGFDRFFGYLGQSHAHRYYPDFLFDDTEKIYLNNEIYSHDLIMEKALDFIDKQAGTPFFIYLAPTIPHAELLVPDGELGGYDGAFCETPFPGTANHSAQPQPRATYAAMVSRLDRDVSRIMELLERHGIAENTIVMFTSDNGVHREGGHDPDFFKSAGPFRGIKRDLYEGGIRTPFVVHWPAGIAPGTVSYHVSAFWDFLPTVCDILDRQPPAGIDGISFLPTLTGHGEQLRHGHLYWEFHESGGRRAVLRDNWKLIQLDVNDPAAARFELYNLSSDPGELADVYSQYPGIAAQLEKLMLDSRTPNHTWNFSGQ